MTREAAAKALARRLYDDEGFHAADSWATESSIRRGHYEALAESALAAIERGGIPGVGVLPESETLTEGERADLRHCPECGHDWSGHVDPPLPFMTCSGKRGLGSVSGCRCVLTQADVVERILASRARPASVDAETPWSESDRRDVSAWLTREADQRVKFFPQRRDGVDALMRHLAVSLASGVTLAARPCGECEDGCVPGTVETCPSCRGRLVTLAADREPDVLRAKEADNG